MISVMHALFFIVCLFILGLIGTIIRRNLFFILLGLEIMINSVSAAFIVISTYLNQIDGQIMYILILTLAASESGVCLMLLLRFYKKYRTLDIDIMNEMSK